MIQKLVLVALAFAAVLGAGPTPGAAQAPSSVPGRQQRSLGRAWSANWIWSDGEPAPRNSYTYFRKRVKLDNTPKETRIHLTADSRYQLFVNGTFVGRGPVRSDRRWLYYDTWDLTPHLKKGDNVLAVLVHHFGESTFQYMQGRGGLLAEVVSTAGKQVARTDESWRALRSTAWAPTGPRMSIQLGFNEVYDARQAPQEWTGAKFDDSAWPIAKVIGAPGMEPWPSLVPRDIPPMMEVPLRAVKILEAVEIEEAAAGSVGNLQFIDLRAIMDRKEYAVAYVSAVLISPEPQEVELSFGSDDALRVWVNDHPPLIRLVERGAAPDQDKQRLKLDAGANLITAKVVQGHSDWGFYFRVSGNKLPLEQEASDEKGPVWRVVGPFPYDKEGGLKRGLEALYWPEHSPQVDPRPVERVGFDLKWRNVKATPGPAQPVSAQMATAKRRPLGAATVRNPEHLLQDEPRGAVIKTTPGAGVSFLVDFGKEVTGYPRFRVRGAKGGEVIDLGYGEVLHDEKGGFIPQSSDRVGKLNPDRDGVHYADRYVCRPGSQTFQTFDKRGFRYMQVDVHNAEAGIELDDVSLLFSTYPVQYRGAFNCSDERLNRIWEIGRWTCQLNMEDGYTDCPWRERGQWWGDARVEALINYYCFGDTALIKKCLRQQGQSLNEEGMTWVYPTDWDGGRLPSFTLIWISTLLDTYRHTGDLEIVRELFPKVRYVLDKFFAPKVGPRGLLKDIPYWVFIDWAPVDDKGEMGSLNAYYYDALSAASEMAGLLKDPSAKEYQQRSNAVRQALSRELWDAELHVYRDSILPDGKRSAKITQQTNSLCVLFGIAPEAEQGRIFDYIYAPENKSKVVEAGSPYFSYYQLAAMYKAGRHDQALEYIREKWGRMLDWGATTWWEMWQPGASFCHGWSGGPTYDLSAEVLGIKPGPEGFKSVRIEPHWVGLTYASGIVPTAAGPIQVGWSRAEKTRTVALRLETPKGVHAEVLLPERGEIRINGKDRWPPEVTALPAPNGSTRLKIARDGETLIELRQAQTDSPRSR